VLIGAGKEGRNLSFKEEGNMLKKEGGGSSLGRGKVTRKGEHFSRDR